MCFYEEVRGWGDQYILLGVIFMFLSEEVSMELKKESTSAVFFQIRKFQIDWAG